MPLLEGGATMGMFDRFMEKASLTEENDEYFEDEGYGYDDAGEESLVSDIRAVESHEDISRIATCWPKDFSDIATFADE